MIHYRFFVYKVIFKFTYILCDACSLQFVSRSTTKQKLETSKVVHSLIREYPLPRTGADCKNELFKYLSSRCHYKVVTERDSYK